jgi:hypothetical protein
MIPSLILLILGLQMEAHAATCMEQGEALRIAQKAEREEFEKKIAPSLSYEEGRKQRRALSDAQLAKSKADFDQCMEQRRIKQATQEVQIDSCHKEIEQKMKANWDRLTALQETRPKLPSVEEGKAAFESYVAAKQEFRKKLDELEAQVKSENKALSESLRSCRSE